MHLQNHGQPLGAIRRLGLAMDAVGGEPLNVGPLALVYVPWPAPTSSPASSTWRGPDRSTPCPILRAARSPTRSGCRGVAAFVAAIDGELTAAE